MMLNLYGQGNQPIFKKFLWMGARRIAAGAPWTGMLLGVVGEVVATFLVLLLMGPTLVTPLCNRG